MPVFPNVVLPLGLALLMLWLYVRQREARLRKLYALTAGLLCTCALSTVWLARRLRADPGLFALFWLFRGEECAHQASVSVGALPCGRPSPLGNCGTTDFSHAPPVKKSKQKERSRGIARNQLKNKH